METLSREHILAELNKIIEEEHGKAVTEDSLLIDCDIDSFGYAILWLEINNNICQSTEEGIILINHDYVNCIDYSTYKVNTLIDKILEVSNTKVGI